MFAGRVKLLKLRLLGFANFQSLGFGQRLKHRTSGLILAFLEFIFESQLLAKFIMQFYA